MLHEPGKIVRHFGTAEDPLPEGSFGRATIARPGESVADYIKSYPQSSLAQWALQSLLRASSAAEDVYARSGRHLFMLHTNCPQFTSMQSLFACMQLKAGAFG